MDSFLETEQPQTKVRRLIHSDDPLILGIIEEAQIRQRLLNAMIDAGIQTSEIQNVISQNYVDQFLFQKHLQSNKAMAREYSAGKKAAHLMEAYSLPASLEHLKDVMKQWLNYPVHARGSDKFRHLKFVDGRYELNEESLEKEFELKKLKIYISHEKIEEAKILDAIIDYVVQKDLPLHQIAESAFWSVRFTRDSSQACNRLPNKKLLIKRSYFINQ